MTLSIIDYYSAETPGYGNTGTIQGAGILTPEYGPTFPACETGDILEVAFGFFMELNQTASGQQPANNQANTMQFVISVNGGAPSLPAPQWPIFNCNFVNDPAAYAQALGGSNGLAYGNFHFEGAYVVPALLNGAAITIYPQFQGPKTPTANEASSTYAMSYYIAKRYRPDGLGGT